MESYPPVADFAAPYGQDGDARLQLAIEEAGLATWDTDFIAGESIWSPNHFRLFGYPVDPTGRATLEMWSSRLHPEDRQRALAELEKAKRERTLYRSEYRIVRADTGDIAWIEPRGRFLYDRAGRATHLVGVCLETTMRKHAEERLVWREEQLALATRLVGIGVFDHDHLENQVYWSRQFRQIHDMPPHIAPQLELIDAQTHDEDREPLRAAVRAAHDPKGDGQFSFEYRIKRHDGEVRWIVARARTIFIGEGADRHALRTVGAELDVTDRRLAEARVRESEARFRTMADGSPVMIWAMDRFGAIEFVNKAFREFFGVTPERVRHDGWRGLLHADDAARYMSAYADAATNRTQFRAQARVRSGSGDWRWIESYATPRIGPKGQFLGYVGVSPDVTVLMEAQDALRQADQRKDQFLATLAHELRNPLAPIRVAAEMLALPALDEKHLLWSREVIQRQVNHMSRLLDDLLDVARITRGKLRVKKQPVDLPTIVDTAVEAARPLIKARMHGLTIDLPPELPTLDADPVRLAQVLSNLLTNAAKYTDSPGRITLSARAEGSMLRISVKDNGIGLSPSSLAHIFDMFSQGPDDSDRAEGGLGIGLALVKGIVDLHDGTIEATSDGPGFGSEFVVTLPCHEPGTTRSAAPITPVPPATIVPRRILIADDNDDAADSLAMLLQLGGHEVRTAHGGHSALALANSFRPEIALLDIGMPDIDGYEVAQRLRETDWGREVRLVALTGWGQEEDKRRARAAGFDHHLTKPIDPRELEELLASGARPDASPSTEGS